MKQKHIEKEWKQLVKQEKSFLNRNKKEKQIHWQEKIAGYVPEKLNDTLNMAFLKAFELIFEKGTGIIEKTYSKEKKEQNYKINAYTAQIKDSRKGLKAFGKEAKASQNFNMAVSAVEGIGMGLLGMGLPDIPIFLGVLLKTIYEIAASYGFSYDTEEEQIFILKVIETALSHEERLLQGDMEINRFLEGEGSFDVEKKEQILRASDALSKELLYLKFIQGIPIAGVLGGLSDMIYQKKISDYAALKYKRRFFTEKGVVYRDSSEK